MKLERIKSVDREEYIFRQADYKKVLHVGCSDMPFTKRKVEKGSLLHQRIIKNAKFSRLAGVDISDMGVSFMKAAGIDDLHVVDSDVKLLGDYFDEKFDLVIAGEVLEHIPNMGNFIQSLKSVCDKDSLILITVPNFAPIKRIFRLFWFNEEVHPDHVCYFSLSTLTSLFEKCGIEAVEWKVYWRDSGKVSAVINKLLRKISVFQYFSDGFCVLCRVPEE
ncbi:MAG: class I SAM-dependent methyltransferase [Porticoccaceae bacterium]|nr:class I SAM-dependent methyltransferase [Porticoccaceae bacterium]